MRPLRHVFRSALATAILAGAVPFAALAQTPYSMAAGDFKQNFSTVGLWANTAVSADYAPGTAPADSVRGFFRPATTLGAGGVNTIPLINGANVTNTTVFSTTTGGGVQKGTQNLVLLATGSSNATATDLLLNFTGRNAGSIQFDWSQVNNSTGLRPATFQLYTSPDGVTFTQLGSDIVVTNNAVPVLTGTFVALLPASFNNNATARVRFYIHTGPTAANAPTGGDRSKFSIDNLRATSSAMGMGSPNFAAAMTATTPTTDKGTPSAGQGVSFSGSDLTSTITATTAAPFQVSTSASGPWSTTATIPQNLSGGLFVRLNSATAGTFSGSISYAGGGLMATPANTTLSGKALALEPTTQPTVVLSNPTFNTVDVALSGGNGQKYLVVARPAPDFTNQAPSDGFTYSADNEYAAMGASTVVTAVTYVVSASAATTFTITGLTSNTQYFVAAFSYNDDAQAGSENYLVDGFPNTAPSDANRAGTTTLSPPPNTYRWVGPANGSYTTAANWTSVAGSPVGTGQPRTTPAIEDVLTFGNGTSSVLVDLLSNQQIGGLVLSFTANVTLTLNGATDRVLTIAGTLPGIDFSVPASATLNLRNNTSGAGLKLTLITPTTGAINGTLDMNGAAPATLADHQLSVSGVAEAVEVTSSGSIMVGANSTGSAISGASALVFRNGSMLTQNGGSTPTAVFEPMSDMVWNQNSTLGLSNRSYGNLTMLNHATGSSTGGGTLSVNNLTFSATGKTLNINLTGGMTIAGNLAITAGTLNFLPPSGSLTLTSPTATVTTVSPLTLSGMTFSKPNGATLALDNLAIGTVAVTLGSDLNIRESLTFTTAAGLNAGANTLTLLSTNTRTAYVVSTGTGTGTATVQRAIDGNLGTLGLGYRHYSSPVTGLQIGTFAAQFSGVINPAYNTAPDPNLVMPFPTVYEYDPSRVNANTTGGFTRGYASPDATDVMTPGKGFSVNKGPSTVSFAGPLVTGARSLALTGNGTLGGNYGWNLVGNPYPSALDWNQTTVPANVSAVAFVVVPTSVNGGYYQQYAHTAMATNRDLPLAQAFFVRKTDNAPASIALTNAMRVTTNDGDPMNRPAASSADLADLADLAGLHLTIGQTAATVRPEAAIYFDANGTAGLDNYDGIAPARSFGNVPTILTLIGGAEAGVNRLPSFRGTTDVVVPVLIATPVAGVYTIDATLLAGFPSGTRVLLEDAVTGIAHDLSRAPSYAFRSAAAYAGQRFTVRFAAANGVTGLAAGLDAQALSVFPNPASGLVRVSAPAGSTVQVFDGLGRLVRTTQIDAAGTETTLGLTGLKAGLYTVRAGAASQKLVVQ